MPEPAGEHAGLPDQSVDTPHGRLYRPQRELVQVAVLIGAFCASLAAGWLVGLVPGGLSETASTALHVPYVLVFFCGYALWLARLNAIAFEGVGRSVLRTLFMLIVRRQRPKSIEEVLPSREKLLEMAVKAQRAGGSFRPASYPIALLSGLAALLVEAAMSATALFVLVAGTTVGWGALLGLLGRRGWLPIMEEG